MQYMGHTIAVTDDRITISPAIEGVAIEAHVEDGGWIVNDGYNTQRVATQAEAVEAVKDAIGYYAEAE